ncbi:MAG TPA: ThuA domain-containing protein, partial [Thermoanaerobaculia bacterium]|nr:ThuA domain-containing protein [Thermoanaerobaculia bacterium]
MAVLALGLFLAGSRAAEPPGRVLVFSRTTGFRHDSIPDGIAAIRRLGNEHGFAVDATEDASVFADDTLAPYSAVVFLMTTGDVLDDSQQAAFERFLAKGKGFAGVHSAADTEYDWPWYGGLVGAYFKSHPAIQPATIAIADSAHASTRMLPALWTRTDEWYNFQASPRERVHVLAALDEKTYSGGEMGGDHPISWCRF